MPAIKVRAVAPGEYGGHYRNIGDVFFLVDIKHPKTGKILHKAETALAIDGEHPGGWMELVNSTLPQETPAQRDARESKEAQDEADRLADVNKDMTATNAGMAPGINGLPVPAIKGGMGLKAKEGSNAADNSQSAKLVI